MTVKGFELRSRSAYDSLIAQSSEGDVLLTYVKIVYDSIKTNWKWYNRFWYRFKYSPSYLLKTLTNTELIKAVKEIRILEGATDNDLTYLNYQLGLITDEEFIKWIESNKKKAQTIQTTLKQ